MIDILLGLGASWLVFIAVVAVASLFFVKKVGWRVVGSIWTAIALISVLKLVYNPVSKPFNELDVRPLPKPVEQRIETPMIDRSLKPMSEAERTKQYEQKFDAMDKIEAILESKE